MFKGYLFNLEHRCFSDYEKKFVEGGAGTQERWDGLFKFSMVRNPWDRFASFYQHTTKLIPTVLTMGKYMRHYRDTPMKDTSPDKVIGDGELDKVFSFEHFGWAVAGIANALQIERPPMQNVNPSKIQRAADYRQFYDDDTAEIVRDLGAWEIERFGYAFDDCAAS